MTTKVVISGDSSGAVKAIERVRKELGALDSVSKAAFSLGGAISAAGLVAYTKSIIDAADALNEMSERTGISVENLGRLQYAAKLSGVESEQLGKSLQALSGEIVAAAGGSESAIAKFKRLGVSVHATGHNIVALASFLGVGFLAYTLCGVLRIPSPWNLIAFALAGSNGAPAGSTDEMATRTVTCCSCRVAKRTQNFRSSPHASQSLRKRFVS